MTPEEEVIAADIVLIPASAAIIQPAQLAQVLQDLQLGPAEIAQALDGGLWVRSAKRQFEFSVAPTRFELKDLRGDRPLIRSDLQRLLSAVATLTSATFRAGGANVQFTVSLDQPTGHFIAQELLSADRIARGLSIDAGDIVGTAARFTFGPDVRRVTVSAESRFQQTESHQLYINLNVHRDWDQPSPISDETFRLLQRDADQYYDMIRGALARWGRPQ